MRSLVLVAIFAAAVMAQQQQNGDTIQEVYPDGHPFCSKKGFIRQDKSKYYKQGAGVTTVICTKQYLDACYTVDGVVPCNTDYARCVSSNSEWNDANLNPVAASRMNDRPQLCASEGAFWHAETGVLSVAQPIISFIVGVAGIAIVFPLARAKGVSIFVQILLISLFIVCTFLFFSFYYLNAQIALLAAYGAIGLYATKDKGAIATGIFALLATLFWFTFQHGLGEIQHHSRLLPNGSTMYEQLCNSYYRGFFGWPVQLHGPYESPNYLTKGYCLREWLAAEYFFIILVKLILLVLIAYGTAALRSTDPTNEPEPAAAPADAPVS
jgi:hypothetical protein